MVIGEKKLVMMSGGIAHTSYGGVGLGYLLGFEPIIGAFLFSVVAALGIGLLERKGSRTDVVIGLFWSLGMALGILFIGIMPGYPPDLSSYLFGSILSVTEPTLCSYLSDGRCDYSRRCFVSGLEGYLFDTEFAAILGVRTTLQKYLRYADRYVGCCADRVVGIVLVLALMTAPPRLPPADRPPRKTYAVCRRFGALFCVFGLWVSYETDIASGASIVILSVFAILYYILPAGSRNGRHAGLRERKRRM